MRKRPPILVVLLLVFGVIISCYLINVLSARPEILNLDLTDNFKDLPKEGYTDSLLLEEIISNGSDLHAQKARDSALFDAADLKRIEESKIAFLDAYTVFMHPRCMNCHPIGDVPLQGDDSHLHTQGVTRGPDGKGLYANKCANCHQPMHLEGPNLPPGNPVWHLPPAHRKMVFEGKSPRELAMGFKDSAFTGFSTVERIITHVETDHLVINGFTYGTRPPLTHAEFVSKVKEWIDKGAELPDK